MLGNKERSNSIISTPLLEDKETTYKLSPLRWLMLLSFALL